MYLLVYCPWVSLILLLYCSSLSFSLSFCTARRALVYTRGSRLISISLLSLCKRTEQLCAYIHSFIFPHEKNRVAFPGESQLRQSRATHLRVHAGCFCVSIIQRTLTWSTGFLTCAQMLMHAVAHEGVRTHVRESALQEESGRKIPRRTGESNLPQRRDGPTLYQLSCNPASRDDKSWQQVKYVKLYILTCWRQSPKSCDT